MNLLADESVEQEIVDRLRADGHDVVYIAELSPSIKDDQVLSDANARSAILVTGDKDFGELVFRLGQLHAGVVLVRLSGLSPQSKAETVAKVLQDHSHELPGSFCVVAPASVRLRKPATS